MNIQNDNRKTSVSKTLAKRLSAFFFPLFAVWSSLGILIVSSEISFFAALALGGVISASFLVIDPYKIEPIRPDPVKEKKRRIEEKPKTPQLERFVEHLPTPCMLLNQRQLVHIINRHALELIGPLKTGEPLTFRMRAPELVEAVQRVLKTGKAETCKIHERVPTERWFNMHITPMKAHSYEDAETYIIIVMDDLTERHRHERMRADFVANASHELRTPLSSLLGFIETLLGAAKDDEEARNRFLLVMREQAERMSRLIEDLMSLNRIEMRVHVKPDKTVDLIDILNHVLDSLDPLAKAAGVEISKSIEMDSMPVFGEHDELVQVLSNLVENAIKYGASGKKIDLGLRYHKDGAGNWFDLSVRDYGPGIAPQHLPRLTERFYRIDVEESRSKKGTGLGLAIVKHILNRHRGRLLIDSHIGKGATFTIRLPAKEISAPFAISAEKDEENQLDKMSQN
jgi:two-component system phosphate regulon sensor histidine kinase PhoR